MRWGLTAGFVKSPVGERVVERDVGRVAARRRWWRGLRGGGRLVMSEDGLGTEGCRVDRDIFDGAIEELFRRCQSCNLRLICGRVEDRNVTSRTARLPS